MGLWRIDADTRAGSRFVVSPLAEAPASLIALANAAPHPGQRAWLDAHLPAYRELLAADPITALLVKSQLGRHRIAVFPSLRHPARQILTSTRSSRGSATRRPRPHMPISRLPWADPSRTG